MEFEWDHSKNKLNIEKHGISFDSAPLIFGGVHISLDDLRNNYGEDRRIAIGTLGPKGRIAVVAYTIRNSKTRIISMRKANEREQKRFIDRLEAGGYNHEEI